MSSKKSNEVCADFTDTVRMSQVAEWLPFQGERRPFFNNNGVPYNNPLGPIIIVGCGGVGFWMSIALAATLPNDIIIYDYDNFVGGHGHERLPRTCESATLKVDRHRAFVAVNFPDLLPKFTYYGHRFGTNAQRLITSCALGIDATDADFVARAVIWDSFQQKGIPMLRVSYDASVVTFSPHFPMTVVENGGYATIPDMSTSFLAAGLGAIKIKQWLSGQIVGHTDFYTGKEVVLLDNSLPQVAPSESTPPPLPTPDESVEGLYDEDDNLIGWVDADGVEQFFESESAEATDDEELSELANMGEEDEVTENESSTQDENRSLVEWSFLSGLDDRLAAMRHVARVQESIIGDGTSVNFNPLSEHPFDRSTRRLSNSFPTQFRNTVSNPRLELIISNRTFSYDPAFFPEAFLPAPETESPVPPESILIPEEGVSNDA